MSKIEPRKLSKQKIFQFEKELRGALLHPKKKEDSVSLIMEVLTPSERIMAARRIQVAKRLLNGESYISIKRKMKVGFPMIHNVDTWLESNFDEYKNIIPPLLEEAKEKSSVKGNRKKPLGDPYTFTGLRRRYPDKFALINMLLDD
jgi:uncharacterized protein YerC